MTVSLSPEPSQGPRCIAGRLRRRGAVLRETLPSPPRGGWEPFDKAQGRIRESHTRLSH